MSVSGYIAGFERAIIWRLKNNYAAGTVGSSMANGSTSSAYVADDVTQANVAYQAPQTVVVTGGDREVAQFQFGNPKSNTFNLTMTLLDPDLFAQISASAVDSTTNSKFVHFSNNTYKASPTTIGMALMQRFQSKAGGSTGNETYNILMVPRCTAIINSGGFNYRAVSNVTVVATPTFTTAGPNGMLFSDMNMSLTSDRVDQYNVQTDYPIHITTFISDGSATTFTAPYLPVSSTVTLGATYNWFSRNGTPQALSSFSTTTGVATMAAAGTAGDVNVLIYQTAFTTA